MTLKFSSVNPFDLNRRALLTGTMGLIFALGSTGFTRPAVAREAANADGFSSMWLRIAPNGVVTIIFPMTEMGQGSSTTLPLIVAEELDADWDKVRIEQLDRDDRAYGNPLFGNILYTAGSSSVMAYWIPLRLAGAQVRRYLIALAAHEWAVPATQLTTGPGMVLDTQSDRRLTYGELAVLDDGSLPIPEVTEADLKPVAEFRLIGKNIPRRDVPAKSIGAAQYAIDVSLPDMVYASVIRAPVEGESPLSVDDAAARAASGVLDIINLPDGMAVAAESLEAALAGRDLLKVVWSKNAPARAFDSEKTLQAYAKAAADAQAPVAIWSASGDAGAAIDGASKKLEREYRSDYAYHAQIEPMACVARVDADGKGAEVWAGTQTQTLTTDTVAKVLDTAPDRVRLHMMTMGGSFGRRTALMQEYVRDALLVSKATGRPAKVVWTREDDLRHGWFRPAAVQHLSAGLDSEGTVSGWRHRVATPSVIAAFNPVRWEQVKPKDIISMRGSESKFYNLRHLAAEHVITPRQARIIPWRAIGASYTGFAAEAFMDELAQEAGVEPLEFRKALLADNPRGLNLLDKVAEMSQWSAPRTDMGLGMAFAGYGDTMVAGVVEIGLDRQSGVISVQKVWVAVDAGVIVLPDNAHAQLEGAIIYGISSALKEQVTISKGEVEQSNFHDYEILRANECPEIATYFATVDAAPTGMGEAGTPMVPAAIANAFHNLTGRRLRHMPFTPERVLAALG
ncbi:MAG: molybdopterin cofactor-binding domain-containing protein [Pseudomonadota bacterium]